MLTPLKVSMKKFLKRTFKETNKKVIKHPILFASGFACIKNSIADYTIQNVQNIKSEKPKPFNIKRNLTFALFGLLHDMSYLWNRITESFNKTYCTSCN